MCTTKRVSLGSWRGHSPRVLFLSTTLFLIFLVSWSDFDSWCKPCIFDEPVLHRNLIFVLRSRIRSFKTVVCSSNFLSHCLWRECGTYTFNRISLALWWSQNLNEGDLFGSSKIHADKSCNQLLEIVLWYRECHPKASYNEIFWYSKELKSLTIDKCQKVQNTHLTPVPILKQCAVYSFRPLIDSKPGSSFPEQYSLNNITSHPWSDATCRHTISDSVYFRFVTLFSSKNTRSSTKSNGMGAGWVRLWLTRDVVYTGLFRRGWARFGGGQRSRTINGARLRSRRVSWFFARLVSIQSRTNRFLHSVSVAVTIRGTRFEVSGQ